MIAVRMSEQNLASILDSVEELYRKYRRNGGPIHSVILLLLISSCE